MSYQYRVYMHGLVASIVNAVSSSAVVVMADPVQFNLFQGGATKLGAVAGVSAVVAFFTYLKDHPLPDPEKDNDFVVAQRAMVQKVTTGTGDSPAI